MSVPRILVVGDVCLDCWGTPAAARPSPEVRDTLILTNTNWRYTAGMAGLVAANVVSLGGEALLYSCIGEDMQGSEIERALGRAGVAAALWCVKKRPSTTKSRLAVDGALLPRLDEEDVSPIPTAFAMQLAEDSSRAIEGGKVDLVVVSDYGKGVCTPELCQALVSLARKAGLPVIVDPKGTDPTKYAGATIATPNARELESLGGLPVLLAHISEAVVVTDGPNGMTLHRGYGMPCWIPAETEAADVVDVTGAGDTVVAALAVELGRGVDLLSACRAASVAAGIAVRTRGTAAVDGAEWRARLEATTETTLALR